MIQLALLRQRELYNSSNGGIGHPNSTLTNGVNCHYNFGQNLNILKWKLNQSPGWLEILHKSSIIKYVKIKAFFPFSQRLIPRNSEHKAWDPLWTFTHHGHLRDANQCTTHVFRLKEKTRKKPSKHRKNMQTVEAGIESIIE